MKDLRENGPTRILKFQKTHVEWQVEHFKSYDVGFQQVDEEIADDWLGDIMGELAANKAANDAVFK